MSYNNKGPVCSRLLCEPTLGFPPLDRCCNHGVSMFYLSVVLFTLLILQLTTLGTTIFLHRSLTHRGIELSRPATLFFHAVISLFTGIVPREWAAVHRKHHQFSDKEGDPHSPYLLGLWHVFFGNVVYYRRCSNDAALVRKYTPDYKPTWIDKVPKQHLLIFVGMGIFVGLFGWAWGLGAFFAHAFTYIFLNASINSICHMIGYRNFDNLATNLQWLALITGGEALHNNHHERPTAARFSMKPGEIDPAWPVIRMLEMIGWAKVKPARVAQAA